MSDTEPIPDRVTTLYALVTVEHDAAKRMEGQYAYGRQQGYELVIEAMEARWPTLKTLGRRIVGEMHPFRAEP